MNDVRIIKKYPNRRLYDTAISSYITLHDIKELVMSYTPFKVVDAKTSDDLTRATLLQIISEEEEKGTPIFSTDILLHCIRMYGDSMQAMAGRFLEQSMKLFENTRRDATDPMKAMWQANPLQFMQSMAEQNLNMLRTMQRNFFNPEPRANKNEEATEESDKS
ncbi:polyhydroxyalkanoate synthesis repressor PhaR [Permianibacter aggregans]|uniref:Polyhydroxyalkanoate synthesis repressor PhaR n=1 Tax=Permianibacter aggregans TaxID=1510150 RepID=A0A4R6USX8_9GAMM|nr:polyhydroxyalkanoate synthesis repressor PhaR [Permianibacter aggregans]QGX40627.1 polyhydroxyalkanoate synthesis repressor PhaR [Permianibacter aggregans]TDQ46494.1 polyhydroxyalkanoate synthesis repressor PhaR [Permianibacter aggregans]